MVTEAQWAKAGKVATVATILTFAAGLVFWLVRFFGGDEGVVLRADVRPAFFAIPGDTILDPLRSLESDWRRFSFESIPDFLPLFEEDREQSDPLIVETDDPLNIEIERLAAERERRAVAKKISDEAGILRGIAQ